MLPRFSIDDVVDGFRPYAKLFGKNFDRFSLSVSFSYLDYLSLREFGAACLFSTGGVSPTFFVHIRHVVCMRSQEQMSRIHTGSIVTMMTNKHSIWNFPICKSIAEAMSIFWFSIKTKFTIAGGKSGRLPFPTIIDVTDCHVPPKSTNGVGFCFPSGLMIRNKPKMETPDYFVFCIRICGDSCLFAASTHTKTRWIRIGANRFFMNGVACNKTSWFTLCRTASFFVHRRNSCLLPTSTLTLAIRSGQPIYGDPRGIFDCFLGCVRSMISHVLVSFQTWAKPGMFLHRPASSFGFYRCNYSTITPVILFFLLLTLTPTAVANRCKGEFSAAIAECACTVKNRLDARWREDKVLSAYFAKDSHATPAQVAQVAAVLDGSANCDSRLYFMYSRQDTIYLGIGHYTPALVVCNGDKCVQFYERWFRRK